MASPVLQIVRQEIRQRRWYLLWWSLGIVALVALTVLAYGSIKGQADELNKSFGHLSSGISSFVGTSDMFSPVGYLNSQLFYVTLPILFIILSITLVGSLVSKEERRGTLELLLARPVGRSRLLVAKVLSAALVIVILGAVTALCTVLCSMAAGIDISVRYLLLTTAWMVVFSSAFGAVAFMLYAASRKTRRMAATVAILLSFGGYILSSLSGLVSGLAWAGKLLPYHYYDPGSMLTGHVAPGLIAYTVAIYVVSLVVAFTGFSRRDVA